MNVPGDNIIVNSCEYTPIYLIPSASVSQAGSYIITQSNQEERKPVADNLKTYYENSGNLESGILSSPKPRILKKQSSSVVGNNLKLASFLLPKTDPINVTNIANVTTVQPQPSVQAKQPIPIVNNVKVKPAATSAVSLSSSNVDNSLARVEVDRKIVRVGTIPALSAQTKRINYPRVLQKNKPLTPVLEKKLKEKIDPDFSKHTSVQLIQLGETYHSLNQLSDEQMKIVNKALKMFAGDPEKVPKEPAASQLPAQNSFYDPVTNTKFFYKLVSPRDLTVVGRNKTAVMKKKSEAKKQKLVAEEPKEDEPVEMQAEPKVTRSGRTVKRPKQMRAHESPHKPKKKVGSVVNCFQCSAEFCSFYRLQRHYEMYPTHIPARIHSNLFHCLLAIIKGGGEDDQANIFIQQLEQLIEKIRSLLPCLLVKIEGKEGKLCTINEDIGRLFGMNAGKYNLNIDALSCVKDKDGHCIHNPAPKPIPTHPQKSLDRSTSSQTWHSQHNEDIADNDAETEDCARINSVDKWPTVTKRIWKLKQQKQQNVNAKKMRLASENEQPIELGTEDMITFSIGNENDAINEAKCNGSHEVKHEVLEKEIAAGPSIVDENQIAKPKTHAQFHSAHFDIRSSPIKLPSSLVRKFQLNPDKMTNFEVQILRPLPSDKETVQHTKLNDELQSNTDLQEIFKDNIELPKETTITHEINFDTPKSWQMTDTNDSTDDSFLKSSILFDLTPEKTANLESSLLHINNKQPTLFDTPSKTHNLTESNLLEIVEKSNNVLEPSVILNQLFDTKQTDNTKEQHSDFYDTCSMHVKPKCNSLIGSSVIQMKEKTFESALSHVKERSNNLFGESLLETKSKSISLLDNKNENLFNTDLSHTKERSNSLFESNILDIKVKDILLNPSLLRHDNSNFFDSSISNQKDGLLHQSVVNNLNGTSLLHKVGVNPVNIDMNQDSNLSTSDNSLLNPDQSVLNFFDSLGNEPLTLAYPETEIRNNNVDFQLDPFLI